MIGRKDEIRRLNGAFSSSQSEFVAVYGRRRIGKTYLITETFNNRFTFHHTGLKEGGTKKQLEHFRLSLRQQGYYDCPRIKDWLEAFFELERFLGRNESGRKVVFLDEVPWLDTPRSGFLVALEAFWNGWATFRKDIVLVVCGSATSWIVKNIIRNSGGLYNRVRTRIKLFPFTLAECEDYANRERHLGYGRRELVESYMALGGVAYYWSLLERGLSPAQNFDRLFFGPQDGLRTEFDELYRSLFRNPKRYMEVVELLGSRRRGYTRDEIIQDLGAVSGGDLTKILSDLEECGFIRRYMLPTQGKNGGTYQIVDNFTLFYFSFVKDNNVRSGEYWTASVSDGLRNAWHGFAFERICLSHVAQIKAALGISGVETEAYSLRVNPESDSQGAQIDLLIARRDGIVNLCEMKYVNGKYVISSDEAGRLRHRIEVVRKMFGKNRMVHLTMVTPEGVSQNANRWDVQSEVKLDDLFRGL